MNVKLTAVIAASALLALAPPLPAQTVAGLVSLDQALAGAAADIGSKVRERTEIVIARIDTADSDVADFLTDELSGHLFAGGRFIVLERGAALSVVDAEHQFQMSGLVSDESAVGIGHYLGAKVVITGSFTRFADFSQIRLRAIDVRTSQLLTLYTARIRPDDRVLANVTRPSAVSHQAVPLPAVREDALAHLNRGEDLIRERKYDEAIRELDRALSIDGNLAEAYYNRGLAYYYKRDYDLAIADYTSAIRINPNYAEAFVSRGIAILWRGGMMTSLLTSWQRSSLIPDFAIGNFTIAIQINPNYAEAYYNRGYAYYIKREYDRAIADYTSAIRLNPNDAFMYYFRGNAYYDKRDYDRAIADYEAALRINPNQFDTRNRLENARQRLGR